MSVLCNIKLQIAAKINIMFNLKRRSYCCRFNVSNSLIKSKYLKRFVKAIHILPWYHKTL